MEGKILSDRLSLYSKAAKLSLENAEQWIKDAKLLIKNSSFGHASALLRFASEEIAKAYICWFTSEKIWPLKSKPIRDVFRYHRAKSGVFLGLLFSLEYMLEHPIEKAMKDMLEASDEEIFKALEEFEHMIILAEKMRQRAMYVDVNLRKKEVKTPMRIGEKEPQSLLKGAEFFLKNMRYYVEECPEEKKAVLREIFSSIPREAWETGEIPIEWFRKQ